MAKTYQIDYPSVATDKQGNEFWVREVEEGASQTFTLGSPLKWSSGFLIEAADPLAVGSLVGFARRAGQNGSSAGDKRCEIAVAYPGMLIYANFLTTAGATTTIANTDRGVQTDMANDAVHFDGSSVVWYASDETAAPTVEMLSFESDQMVPNNAETRAVAGDSDARVLFKVLDSALSSVS